MIYDEQDAARSYYGTTFEDYMADLYTEQERNGRLRNALEEVLGALEDIGQGEGSMAWEIASKALKEAA